VLGQDENGNPVWQPPGVTVEHGDGEPDPTPTAGPFRQRDVDVRLAPRRAHRDRRPVRLVAGPVRRAVDEMGAGAVQHRPHLAHLGTDRRRRQH
jgi:hypothetical protein